MKKFADLASLFDVIEQTSSRNEITEQIAEFCQAASLEDVQIMPYLLMGRVAPLFVPAEFHYSEKGLISVLQNLIDINGLKMSVATVREDVGDIGTAGFMAVEAVDDETGGKGKKKMSISEVYGALWEVVNTEGEGSSSRKNTIVSELLQKSTPLEAKFICRIIAGKLRLGASDKTVIDALSYTINGDKSLSKTLYEYYGVDPDIGHLAHSTVNYGDKISDEVDFAPTLGIPVLSRLVERVGDFDEVFERLGGEIYLQPKYDGIRCQVHKGVDYNTLDFSDRIWLKYFLAKESEDSIDMFGDVDEKHDVRMFSRNLEEITEMFPELIDDLDSLKLKNVIFDCEVVGWDESKGTFVPFQETMTRKRKYDISGASAKVPVRLYVFDVLFLDDENLVEKDFVERMEILEKIDFKKSKNIHLTDTKGAKTRKQLDKAFEKSVAENLEGLIAKQPGGGYQPGKRNYEWLKLKKSMDKKLVDTVDVVIMGYYFGSGKQVTAGMGALLAGILSEDEQVRSITKIGTGITDEHWKIIAERLNQIESKEKPKLYEVSEELKPDVWVLPEVVCSVEADEVTKSKAHMAGKDENDYGLALRFPRLVEFDRDKGINDATTTKEILKMYKGDL